MTTLCAGDGEVLEGLAEGFFALAFGVDVGGVEEVDAGVDGGLDELVGSGLVDGADGAEEAGATVEGHGTETEGGDEEAGVAKGLILHGISFVAESVGGYEVGWHGAAALIQSGGRWTRIPGEFAGSPLFSGGDFCYVESCYGGSRCFRYASSIHLKYISVAGSCGRRVFHCRRSVILSELREFLELSYGELEDLNLQAKDSARSALPPM